MQDNSLFDYFIYDLVSMQKYDTKQEIRKLLNDEAKTRKKPVDWIMQEIILGKHRTLVLMPSKETYDLITEQIQMRKKQHKT